MTASAHCDLCSADERLDTQVHLPFLRKSAKGTVLEIGVWTGISTGALLAGVSENGGHVYSVDIYAGSRYVWHGEPDWTFVNTSSHNVGEILKVVPVPLDLLFIDGDHSYEGCLADLENWGPRVRKDGLILVHDSDTPAFPGVRRAIDEFCDRMGFKHELRPGSNGLEVIWA